MKNDFLAFVSDLTDENPNLHYMECNKWQSQRDNSAESDCKIFLSLRILYFSHHSLSCWDQFLHHRKDGEAQNRGWRCILRGNLCSFPQNANLGEKNPKTKQNKKTPPLHTPYQETSCTLESHLTSAAMQWLTPLLLPSVAPRHTATQHRFDLISCTLKELWVFLLPLSFFMFWGEKKWTKNEMNNEMKWKP